MYAQIMEKYKKNLEDLKFFDITFYDIYKTANEKRSVLSLSDEDIKFCYYDTFFVIKAFDEEHFFYQKPKTVKYNNSDETLVFSTIQIDNYMENKSIFSLYFEFFDYSIFKETSIEIHQENRIIYPQQKNLLMYVSKEEINFEYIIVNDRDEHTDVVDKKSDNNNEGLMNPINFSKYFFDYFEYNDKDKLTNFIYFNSLRRSLLTNSLGSFSLDRNLKFFKFCGPSSIGKSTTLINFRNTNPGVIYFNFKVINRYENEKKSYIKMMLYELNGLDFSNKKEKSNFSDKLKNLYFCRTFEDTFLNLFEYLKELKSINIIIFDQFKPHYFRKKCLQTIEEIVKNSRLKLIISSSINDKEVKSELMKTIEMFKGMPYIPNKENQDYYIYCLDILNIEDLKQFYVKEYNLSNNMIKILEQFNFYPKYIYLLNKDTLKKDDIIKINDQIIKKMRNLFGNTLSIEAIARIINNFLNKKLEYLRENIQFLNYIPLNYFNIHFEPNYFYIDYAFPYIKTLFNSFSDSYDIQNYFKEKLYEKEIYEQFKGPYFEKFVKNKIIEDKCKFLPKNISHYITVDNLMNLDELENDNNDIFKMIDEINNKSEKKEVTTYKQSIDDKIELISLKLKELQSKNNDNDINYFFKKALEEELLRFKKIQSNNNKKVLETLGKSIIVNNYQDNFKNGGILIDQRQINGRCIDEAFLYGDKNKKEIIFFQMKFYMPSTALSGDFSKSMTKTNIKNNCKKFLANAYLQFGIIVNNWYYFLVFHYDKKENLFNNNLVGMCRKNDLDYIFFDPNLKTFYDKYFQSIEKLQISNLSNLNYEENETNPYMIFKSVNDFQFLFKKRDKERELNELKQPKKISNELMESWERKYNISFKEFFSKFLSAYKLNKKIKIIDVMRLDGNQLPYLNEGYGYLFLNSKKNNLVLYINLNNDKNIVIFNNKDDEEILPIRIIKNIHDEINFEYFIVKLY